MSEAIHERVQRLVREILTVHFELFPVLLAEKGVSPKVQRRRLDGLARALNNARCEPRVTNDGRPVPFDIDANATPPMITVNEELVGRVDDDEFLYALHQPVAEILELSPVSVGLVLQNRDDRQLKSLYNKAIKKLDSSAIRLTTVSAFVDQRLELFEDRLTRCAESFGDSFLAPLEGSDRFARQLRKAPRGWPAWDKIRASSFINEAVELFSNTVGECEGVPAPELIVELCWESLDLSPQSFMREAAQQLRSAEGLDVKKALRSLTAIVDTTDQEFSPDVENWSTYATLAEAWDQLFRSEQKVLSWTPGRRRTPRISVFESPLQSLMLNEPDSLPWQEPLLSWSVREQQALTDLLTGLRRSLEEQLEDDSTSVRDWFEGGSNDSMRVDADVPQYDVEVFKSSDPMPDNYDQLMVRALRANFSRMCAQFESLDPASRTRAVSTLRSAYDGFFGDAKDVWNRRFQAIDALDPVDAFGMTVGELRHILGTNVVFDPFESPKSEQLRAVPTFVIIGVLPAGQDSVGMSLPLTSLRFTFQDTPVRVRLVEVDEDELLWRGDVEVMMETIRRHPTETVLNAVENDHVHLMLEMRD